MNKSEIKNNFAWSVNIKNESYKGPVTVVKLIKWIIKEKKTLSEKSCLKINDNSECLCKFIENSKDSINSHEDFKICKAIIFINKKVPENYQNLTEKLLIDLKKTIYTLVLLSKIFRLMLLYLPYLVVTKTAAILKTKNKSAEPLHGKIMVDSKYVFKKIKVKIKEKDQKFYLYPIMLLQTAYSI